MRPGNSYYIRGLSVQRKGKVILEDINFSLPPDSITAIVGPSGSGKTSLLHAIAGFIPSEGERPRDIPTGMVFQHNGVFPFMTVKENILFSLHTLPRKEAEARCCHLIEVIGLIEHVNIYPNQLSGGQIQRLNFARALAGNPSLLFCDEPFSSLDEVSRITMQEWLSSYITSFHCTTLLVTHSIEEAIFLSDTVLVLSGGAIVESVPIPFSRPRSSDLRFTAPFVEIERHIFQLIQHHHNS